MFFGVIPDPKFKVGDLVQKVKATDPSRRYIVVKGRRWTCPKGLHKRRWVYDGIYIEPRGGELVISGNAEGAFEMALVLVAIEVKELDETEAAEAA